MVNINVLFSADYIEEDEIGGHVAYMGKIIFLSEETTWEYEA
jgi:hypothetical protein